MSKPIAVGPVAGAAIASVVCTVINVVVNQVREGDPDLVRSAIAGVASGVVVTAVIYWTGKNNTAPGS